MTLHDALNLSNSMKIRRQSWYGDCWVQFSPCSCVWFDEASKVFPIDEENYKADDWEALDYTKISTSLPSTKTSTNPPLTGKERSVLRDIEVVLSAFDGVSHNDRHVLISAFNIVLENCILEGISSDYGGPDEVDVEW